MERIKNITAALPSLRRLVDFDIALGRDGRDAEIQCPYYAGVRAAERGDYDKAEELLAKAVSAPETAVEAAVALAEVYRCKAESLFAQDDVPGGVDLLRRANALDPSNRQVAELLKQFSSLLPVLHVIGGQRDNACTAWIKAVEENPNNIDALRSLAVLYFFWAREHLEASRLKEACECWSRSAECWSMLLRSSAFVSAYADEKSQIYGKPVETDLVVAACSHVSESVLREIDASADRFRSESNLAAFQMISRAYAYVLGEIRAAELLATAAALPGMKLPAGFRVGGPNALVRFGGLKPARKVVDGAQKAGLDPASARRLQIAYSGTTNEWGLVEAKKYQMVIDDLERKTGRSVEQNELLAKAYVELGALYRNDEGSERSFQYWVKAAALLGKGKSPLKDDIEKYAVAAAAPASRRAKNTTLQVITRVIKDLQDLVKHIDGTALALELSAALTQAAISEFNDDHFASAEKFANEALRYNEDNPLAKQGLSRIYQKRAIDKFNAAARSGDTDGVRHAAEMMAKAIDIDPSNQQARQDGLTMVKVMLEASLFAEAAILMAALGLGR